jgi:hypothetical protein
MLNRARSRQDMTTPSPRRRTATSMASLAAAVLLGTVTGPLQADELRIEPIRSRTSVDTPSRGMTMDKVRAAWGNPRRQRGAVGDPPIARWEYDGFVVYFEYQYVLHTVVKRAQ